MSDAMIVTTAIAVLGLLVCIWIVITINIGGVIAEHFKEKRYLRCFAWVGILLCFLYLSAITGMLAAVTITI